MQALTRRAMSVAALPFGGRPHTLLAAAVITTRLSKPLSARLACVHVLAAVLLVAAIAPAAAHDFWLSGHRAAAQAPTLQLRLGDHLNAEETRPYKASATASFRLLTAGGERDLAVGAGDARLPFLTLPEQTPLPALFALDRNPVVLALGNAKFASYLREEHLDDILARHPTRKRDDRERYTRHIKLLVTGADGDSGGLHDRVLGMPLEIVLLDPPGVPAAGRRLRARVLFDGAPLAGRTLTVLHDPDAGFDAAVPARTVVTDDNGIATFAYEQPGFRLLRLVYMQPCDGCKDADWRSWWGAYAIQDGWLPAR